MSNEEAIEALDWMLENRFTPSEIAQLVGVSESAVSRWRSQTHIPSLKHQNKMLVCFELILAGLAQKAPSPLSLRRSTFTTDCHENSGVESSPPGAPLGLVFVQRGVRGADVSFC